jgi:hypothetical protein
MGAPLRIAASRLGAGVRTPADTPAFAAPARDVSQRAAGRCLTAARMVIKSGRCAPANLSRSLSPIAEVSTRKVSLASERRHAGQSCRARVAKLTPQSSEAQKLRVQPALAPDLEKTWTDPGKPPAVSSSVSRPPADRKAPNTLRGGLRIPLAVGLSIRSRARLNPPGSRPHSAEAWHRFPQGAQQQGEHVLSITGCPENLLPPGWHLWTGACC